MGQRGHLGSLAAALVAAGLVAQGPVAVGASAATPPANLGFEDGTLGGDPQGWTVEGRADGPVVVDEETGADSPTYAATGTVVTPYNGDLMVRLGMPKEVAETQPPGPTAISQTFAAPGGELLVAARFLSWEFRDEDRVTLSATGARLDAGVTFFGGGARRTCAASRPSDTSWTCTFTIGGRKGDLLDSGWRELRLVPTGGDVTLRYSLEGTTNSSHATWGYLDDVNRPPVAQFTSEPPPGELVYEGSTVQLRDTSYDPDVPDDIVAWHWTVTPPSGPTLTSDAPDPSFVPPDDGPYGVVLDVTSSDGLTRRASRTVDVTNTPALVNALDVEVLPGRPAPLLARYLDAGWLDTHTVTAPGTEGLTHELDASPGLARGVVRATRPASTSGGAVTFTVDDGEGPLAPTSSDTAQVTVVTPDPQRGEGDDTIGSARPATANASRLGWLQSPGDVDVVEVMLEGSTSARPLLAGTEVVVALDEVPADLDVVVLALPPATQTAPYQMAPYQMAPYQMAPYQMAPYQMAPYQMATIERAPYQMAPYQMAPYQMAAIGLSPYQMAPIATAPYQMAPYQMAPLSTDPFVVADGTGGGDIDASELGVEHLLRTTTGLQVAGFSANRGLASEHVLVRVDQPGTRLFAAVVGANGVASDQPYRLRLESSVPMSTLVQAADTLRTALEGSVCQGAPLLSGRQSRTVIDHSDGSPETLVVTQLERLRTRASSDAEWARFRTSLDAYARAVDARIVSVEDGATFEDWDAAPCDVAAANRVTDLVRDEVRAQVDPGGDGTVDAGWQYLVVLGDDAVMPFRRTTTGVVIGDEAQYLGGSFLRPGSPLAAALASSQELTDDFLSDLRPQAFQSAELYLPDLATGRIVETPSEIADQLDAFLASSGGLDASTALVTAHDFLADGGDTIASSLAQRLAVDADTTDNWTADDLRCRWLGIAEACTGDTGPTTPDVVSPNSHWTHYASLSADGFTTGDLRDVLTSQEVGATSALASQLVFTIGCHAGFSVPDAQGLDGTAYGIDPQLDFAQAMARRQAVFVASTGFGLGETEGLAGTEALMARFAQELMADEVTAGQALRTAKGAYLDALSTVSTYDVKSLVQQVLYGPPQYRVTSPAAAAPATATTTAAAPPLASDGPLAPTLEEVTLEDGRRYWTADGDVQVTPGRPWQPRVVRKVTATTRGALVMGGTFRQVAPVDPVVTRPTMEWETGTGELDACHRSWWPADLVTVTDRSMVVVPGQFRCQSADGTGTQRLYTSLDLDVLESTLPDRTPPMAGPLDVRGVTGGIELSFPASDASGIARIVPLRLDPATGTMTSVDVTGIAPDATGRYRVVVPGASADEEFVVQVADGAGNVTTLTGRGANLRWLPVRAPSPVLATPGTPTTFTATVDGFAAAVGPVQYLWSFGDGTTASGTATTATFDVSHTYASFWGERLATLRVWDADGRTGTVDVVVARRCDPTGDVTAGLEWGDIESCGVTVSGGRVTFSLGYQSAVSSSGTYRVEVDARPGAKKSTLTQLRYTPPAAGETGPGTWTGASSLTVVRDRDGRVLRFTVDARDLGVSTSSPSFAWRADVQSGVPGSAGDGILDRLPDSGWLSFPGG